MDFFHQQSSAARRLQLLRILFLAVVSAVALLLGLAVYLIYPLTSLPGLPWSAHKSQLNVELIAWLTVLVATILMLTAYQRRLRQLRNVHALLAEELGGCAVTVGDADFAAHRLCRVVEEMAIAAGIAVPRVYILSQEHGINALAFGANPQQGSLAVTRGAVELLQRDELQALIGHEICHLLRGDTVLNTRLAAASHSLSQLSRIGSQLRTATVFGARLGPIAKSPVSALLALAGLLTGGLLQLFGSAGALGAQCLQAFIGRNQERYADAAAVQFTRNPDAFARLLKLIAASPHGAFLSQAPVTFSHMLFAPGHAGHWLSVHPPLEQRIALVDPNFSSTELAALREQLLTRRRQLAEQRRAHKETSASPRADMAPEAKAARHSNLHAGAALLAALPPRFDERCSDPEWVIEMLCAALLAEPGEPREAQLLLITQQLGPAVESRTRLILEHWPGRDEAQRLAAWELSVATFRTLPTGQRVALAQLADALVRCLPFPQPFDVALARLLRRDPGKREDRRGVGNLRGRSLTAEKATVEDLLNILAQLGNTTPDSALKALTAAQNSLWPSDSVQIRALSPDWPSELDRLLTRLSGLSSAAKDELLEALLRCVQSFGINPTEQQWLRVIATSLGLAAPMQRASILADARAQAS